MMPSRRRHLVGALLVVILSHLTAPSALAAPGAAGTGAAGSTTGPGGIAVHASAARPAFPKSITFTLDASSTSPIVDVKLFYRPVAAQVTQLVEPKFTPGPSVTIGHDVDMTVNYLPPGIDLQFYWSLTDSTGAQLDSPVQIFRYQDERFNWRTVQGGQVTVLFYSGNDAFGQEILDMALSTRDRLNSSFGVTGDRPIHIVVYGNNRDFSSSLPPNSAEWIGGQAHPDLGLIVTGIQPGAGATAEIGRIIPHEMSHQLLFQATENPYGGPSHWLDEGLAVYNQVTPDSRLSTMLQQAVDRGALIPVRALNSNFPFDPDQALLSYAESVSIVEFIIKTYGDAKLGQLLTSFRNELSYDQALVQSLGVDSDGLDAAWKQSLGYQGDRAGAAVKELATPSRANFQRAALFATVACVSGLAVLSLGGMAIAALVFSRKRRAVASR